MIVDYRGFGARIRSRRRELRLTQEKLAELLDVSHQYVALLESGKREPSMNTFVSLCYALELSPNALLCDSMPEELFGDQPLRLRQLPCILRNTLSNWLLVDQPDESLDPPEPVPNLATLPALGFLGLEDEMPSAPAISFPFNSSIRSRTPADSGSAESSFAFYGMSSSL